MLPGALSSERTAFSTGDDIFIPNAVYRLRAPAQIRNGPIAKSGVPDATGVAPYIRTLFISGKERVEYKVG
jgi:hypothetical protein